MSSELDLERQRLFQSEANRTNLYTASLRDASEKSADSQGSGTSTIEWRPLNRSRAIYSQQQQTEEQT